MPNHVFTSTPTGANPTEMKKVALIGLGRMASWIEDEGGLYSHAKALAEVPGLTLAAGCDPSPAAREAFAARWKIPAVFHCVRDMLTNLRPEVVVIASPAECHLEHIEAVLQADSVSHIVCEKPLAVSREQASAASQLVIRSGKSFVVNHSRRWCAVYGMARQWIQSGRIGVVNRLHAWYGGGVMNIGTHLVDALRYLCGEFQSACSIASSGAPDDPDIDGILRGRAGHLAVLQANAGRNFLIFEIHVLGSEGAIRITANGAEVQLCCPAKTGGLLQVKEHFVPPPGEQPLLKLYGELLLPGHRPRCDVEDAAKAVALAQALLRSSRMRNAEVFV